MPVHNDKNITSTDDLVSSIHTFLTTGMTFNWTSRGIALGSNTAGLSADTSLTGQLNIQFTWTSTTTLNIFQSLETLMTAVPGSEVGDATIISKVIFPITVANAELWVFANDTTTAADRYAHCVVEFNKDGRFFHFGFGQMRTGTVDKSFPWIGGAYKYGMQLITTSTAWQPWNTSHQGPLLDSKRAIVGAGANIGTMRASGLRDQSTNSVYLGFSSRTNGGLGVNDSNSNPLDLGRCFVRYGPGPAMASFQRGSPNSANVFLIPLQMCFSPETSRAQTMPLGNMPDIRMCNIGNIQPKAEHIIGSGTWKFYPFYRKLTTTSGTELASRNFGIAYKVT